MILEIVPGLDVRAKYRHHRQTAAFFWKPVYTQAEIDDPAQFITDDDKLSNHHTDTVGGQVSVLLSVLGVTGRYAGTRVNVAVEHVWQTTVFGNAWIGNVGLTVPLVY